MISFIFIFTIVAILFLWIPSNNENKMFTLIIVPFEYMMSFVM